MNFINPDDFRSVEIEISIMNLTTQTPIHTESEDILAIQIVEFLENGFVLDVPHRACSEGHHLLIDIRIKNWSVLDHISLSAKVEHTEKLENQREAIAVTMLQVDSATWNKFQTLFSKRQDEINEFMAAAKGE